MPETPASDPAATARAVITELRTLGSEGNRAGQARFGINTARALGVSMAELRPLAARLKRDHALAAALWASGIHEARILAALVDEPGRVTPEQMDAWAAEFDSWDLCDQVCMKLFAHTSHVDARIRAWAADEREFVRRAGFALMAAHAVHARKAADADFLPYLPLIARHADDPRNFVRKAVNWALRQIGKRSLGLHGPELALAQELAESPDRSARWIGKDAITELSDPVRIARLAQRDNAHPHRAARRGR